MIPVPDRYARQMCLPEIGAAGQARLARARVLVVGAGGLGATVLPALVGAGLGEVIVVDPDTVELSNLHRQTLFRMEDLGQPKAVCAARHLRRLNPEVTLSPRVARVGPVLARALIAQVDVVVDAADNFALSYALSDECRAQGKPLICGSVLARAGSVGGFCGAGDGAAPSLRAVFPDLPSRAQTCAQAGVMGPAVAMIGALQAQMTLSVLLGHRPSPLGQMMSVDLTSWRVSSFRFETAPDPEDGPEVVDLDEISSADLVIDLRGEEEAPMRATPHAHRVLPEGVSASMVETKWHGLEADTRIVFACASGVRAWRAAVLVRKALPNRVGIVAVGA